MGLCALCSCVRAYAVVRTVVVVRARFAILRISVRFLILSLFLSATFQCSAFGLNGVFFRNFPVLKIAHFCLGLNGLTLGFLFLFLQTVRGLVECSTLIFSFGFWYGLGSDSGRPNMQPETLVGIRPTVMRRHRRPNTTHTAVWCSRDDTYTASAERIGVSKNENRSRVAYQNAVTNCFTRRRRRLYSMYFDNVPYSTTRPCLIMPPHLYHSFVHR